MNYGNQNAYLLYINRFLLKQIFSESYIINIWILYTLDLNPSTIIDSIIEWKMTYMYRSNLTDTTVKGLMSFVDLSMIRDGIKVEDVLHTKLYSFTIAKTCSMIILNVFENYDNKWNIILLVTIHVVTLMHFRVDWYSDCSVHWIRFI